MEVGKVPLLWIEIGLNMDAIEKINFTWGQQVHFAIYPFPSLILCLKRKLVNFNFRWTLENLNFQVGVGDFQHSPNQACHTQKWKVGSRHFMTFGTTFRVRVRVGDFSIPLMMNVAPKNEKLDLGILWHLEQLLWLTFGTTFRVRVGHFSIPPTMNVTTENEKLDLGILWHLEQLLGWGWVILAYPQPWTFHPNMKSWI